MSAGSGTPSQRRPTGETRTRRGSRSPAASSASGPLDPHLDPVVGQPLGQPLTPLHHGDGLVQGGVEVEVVELGDAADPVGVDVDQRRAVGQRGMDARDHERRRGDVATDPEPCAESLGERRLARTQPARQHHHIAGPEDPGQCGAERAHRLGVRHVVRGGGGAAQLDVRRVAGGLDEAVLAPELPGAGQLLAREHRDLVVPLGAGERLGDQGCGDSVLAHLGDHSHASQPQRRSLRREDQRADVATVAGGHQAAMGQGRRQRLDGLTERVGRGVDRWPGSEGRANDLQHRRGGLRPDPAYGQRHLRSARSPAAANRWSSSALTSSCRSMITRWPAPWHSRRLEPAM